MYNWTKHLNYMGREKINVEYGIGELEMDHWNYGPHHAWTKAGDNKIVRMWQPYNGFEVFPPGSWKDGVVNESVFEIPPAWCKKGGAIFRIGCTDDGWPSNATEDEAAPAAANDLRRAKTKVPRDDYRGSGFNGTAASLNKFLRAYKNVKECSQWTVQELHHFQIRLFTLRSSELDDVYQSANDRRRLFGDLQAHLERWGQSALAESGSLWENMQRDGHCHEAAMWFAHHVTEPMRKKIAETMTIPLLPYSGHKCPHDASEDEARVCDEYIHRVSCQDCHSDGEASPVVV